MQCPRCQSQMEQFEDKQLDVFRMLREYFCVQCSSYVQEVYLAGNLLSYTWSDIFERDS